MDGMVLLVMKKKEAKATKKENPVLRARPTQIFFSIIIFFKFFPKSCKISHFLPKSENFG